MLSWIVQQVVETLCPPPKKPAYLQAESCFTPAELDAIRQEHCVHVLAKYSQTVDDAHFLEWAGLQGGPPALAQGLCRAVRRLSGAGAAAITLEGIIVAKARCEKMDRLTAEDFAFDIMDLQPAGQVSRARLEAVVLGCLQLALPAAPSSETNAATAAAIAAGACWYSGEGSSGLTRDAYAKLCRVSPALNGSLLSLMSNIGRSAAGQAGSAATHTSDAAAASAAAAADADASTSRLLPGAAAAGGAAAGGAATGQADAPSSSSSKGRHSRSQRALGAAQQFEPAGLGPGSTALAAAAAAAASTARGPGRVLLPQLGWGLVSPEEALLQPGWVWLLAAGLAPVQRLEWRLQYNSQKHGLSFSTLMGRVGDSCPTLLLIRDKGGAVFGGIAHAPWRKTGAFYGDHASTIFRLLPEVGLYPASGINANIQWCGVGFSQLPNGLGFGGQVGHYALFIDSTLDQGMSRPAATFANPSLSSEEVFRVDVVEVWQLQPPDEEAAPATTHKAGASALSKAKEDQKILEWAGVGKNYSAAIKDEPIED